MKENFRAAAILTQNHIHQFDHIGVLSAYLNIPLIITEEDCLDICKKYYPMITPLSISSEQIDLSTLSESLDYLFSSSKYFERDLLSNLSLLGLKKIELPYLPHGNGEKAYSEGYVHPKIQSKLVLVYGKQMQEMHEARGTIEKDSQVTFLGNFRYHFYLENRAFYDAIVEEEIFSYLDPSKETIFYAPTWNDGENNGSFELCEKLIEELHPHFNLIIKLHPLLLKQISGKIFQLIWKYRAIQTVRILENYPLIYPLLSRSDIYIGEFSSVGYDFLTFNRPLYFIGNEHHKNRLHGCGITIPESENYASFILRTKEQNKNDYAKEREALYAYAFGHENRLEEIKGLLRDKKSLI